MIIFFARISKLQFVYSFLFILLCADKLCLRLLCFVNTLIQRKVSSFSTLFEIHNAFFHNRIHSDHGFSTACHNKLTVFFPDIIFGKNEIILIQMHLPCIQRLLPGNQAEFCARIALPLNLRVEITVKYERISLFRM